MMNEYSAISPSRNDQWSGKTLLSSPAQRAWRPGTGRRAARRSPRAVGPGRAGASARAHDCSCSDVMAAPSRPARPAPGSPTAPRRSRPRAPAAAWAACGGRAEDRPGLVGDEELRLVARAEQAVGLLLVEAGRAAGVGADLRVRHEVLHMPSTTGCCGSPMPALAAAMSARSLSASSSRRWISSVGESAYLLVAPPGMPGNTVIWPPTLTSSGRIGVPSSRVKRTLLAVVVLTGSNPS